MLFLYTPTRLLTLSYGTANLSHKSAKQLLLLQHPPLQGLVHQQVQGFTHVREAPGEDLVQLLQVGLGLGREGLAHVAVVGPVPPVLPLQPGLGARPILLQYHSMRKKWLNRAWMCTGSAFLVGRVRSMQTLQLAPLRLHVV